jgi:hypothetical protein
MAFAQLGNTFFAGTKDSFLYRSTDNAKTWSPCNTGGLSSTLRVIGLGVLSGRIYLCTTWPALPGPVVYYSSDTGSTWQYNGIYDISGDGNEIRCFFEDSNYWFAGGYGMVRSKDSGKSWQFADTGFIPYSPDVAAIMKVGSYLYEGSNDPGGVWRSSDEGDHWTNISNGFPIVHPDTLHSQVMAILALASSGGHLFAGAGNGVYLWVDSLHWWKNVSDGFDVSKRLVQALAVSGNNLLAGLDGGGIWSRSIDEMVAEYASVYEAPKLSGIKVMNFPNPFSGQTNILVNSEEQGLTTIEVYNILGVKVSTVFSGERDAGDRLFSWNAGNLPSGIYSCVVRMNSQARTIPMILSQSGLGK